MTTNGNGHTNNIKTGTMVERVKRSVAGVPPARAEAILTLVLTELREQRQAAVEKLLDEHAKAHEREVALSTGSSLRA